MLRKEFNEYLSRGYSLFKFIVVTSEEVHKWLGCVKCIIEYNISASITVDQINEIDEGVLKGARKVNDYVLIKEL